MEIISDENFSLKKIAQILDEAYFDVDNDNDKYLGVSAGGSRVLVNFEEENKVLTFISLWEIEKGSITEHLELVNKLNRDIILVRFSVKEKTLWCDQQFLVKGGLTAKWVVMSLKRFGEVCKGAVVMNSEFFS